MFTHPAKRSLSQNFLKDKNIINKIIQHVQTINPNQQPILEIGPGTGALTHELINCTQHFLAIEKDRRLIPGLKDSLAQHAHVHVLEQDILVADLKKSFETQTQPWVIVGNLPYQISTPIMFHLLEYYAHYIDHMVFMFQQEVVDRILARPDTKQYGMLAILTEIYCDARQIIKVPPTAFSPKPKVNSGIIHFDCLETPRIPIEDIAYVLKIAKICLQHRRKTLKNNLTMWLQQAAPETVQHQLEKTSLDLTRRPGTLSLKEFWELSRQLRHVIPSLESNRRKRG